MFIKKSFYVLIGLLFFVINSSHSMESVESIEACENSIQQLHNLPSELFCYILKTILKMHIQDFTIKGEINIDELFGAIKNVRLVNKVFKKIIDKNKMDLIIPLLKELPLPDNLAFDKNSLNSFLSEILKGDYSFESEQKAGLLIMLGADPNIEIDWVSKNNQNRKDPALIFIAINGKFGNLINILCKFGCDINVNGAMGSPLRLAVKYDQIDIVKVLLENGADREANHKGNSPIDAARLKDNNEILNLFESRWSVTKFFLFLFLYFHTLVMENQISFI